jgi:hypothetical protein
VLLPELRRLGPEEFRERAQLTEEQMAALDAIAAGRPPRNALSIIHAIETKIAFAYAKPAQQHDLNVTTPHSELILAAAAITKDPPK